MNDIAILAALGVLVIAAPAFFFLGRTSGARAEIDRQTAAKSTAEETSRRVLAEAERDSEAIRKSAVVSGKEELIKLRENF
jgi:ribonuclease Y